MSSRWAPVGVLLPLAVLVGFAATPSGAAAAATPGGANPYVSQSGSPLPAPAQVAAGSAQKLGAADPSQQLRLVIGLKPPHPAEEEAFIQSLQDKNSPNFHKYLTADEWNARFGPSAQSEADVVTWATHSGLTVTQRYGNHLVVDVQGTVATVQKAFGVQINNYHLGSKSFYSNARSATLPASLSGVVSSVQGMNSLQALAPSSPQAQQQAYPAFSAGPARATGGAGHANGSASGLAAAKAASAKKLGSSGRATGGATGGRVTPGLTNGFYDPTDLYSSQAYDVNALYGQGHCCNPTHNSGVTPPATSIAIATAGSHNGSDFTGFHNQYPYLADHWQEFFIDGTPTCCDFEGTMDFEWSTAMSNSFGSYVDTSMVYMYDGANNLLSTFTDIWNHMLSDGVARIMSTSWGCAESFCYDSGTISTDHNIFNSMLGQGWTLVGISHDHGPYADCAHVSDSYPGSDPDLVSSGGTALQAAGVFSSETAWTGGSAPGSCASNNGGGGGGCSAIFGKPGWQGVATMCSSSRAEPDMSLNAAIGQNVFFGGNLTASGGTSIVAPELAGIFAQINAYVQALGNACGTGSPCPTIGDPHWAMYDANSGSPHHPYYDITSGCTSNDIGGGWCAGPGYDLATGLGSANLFQFAWSILWFSVPELTPPTVTITGPATGAWYNGGTLNWTVVDSGGSFPPTGVAGYTYAWDADPGDPTSEPHGGSGNSFYNGPAFKNSTSGSISLAAAGVGCHTLYVRAWDNIGDSSVSSYGSVCYDPTAPTITSAPNEAFVIGKLGAGSTAQVRTSWAASDSLSGVQGYYVYRRVDLGAWTFLGFQGANSVTQYLAAGHHYQYGIYALDHAGNLSAFSTSSNFGLNLVQETAPSIAYSTGWTLQALPGASGGKVKFSTAAGKTAKFTYVGSRVAWVTTKSPSRGSASVTPSGSGTLVVNTHAAAQTVAYLAFAGAYANGAHTLLIKNLGSSTPRVDVDAFFYIGT